jgi:hypothetical protein
MSDTTVNVPVPTVQPASVQPPPVLPPPVVPPPVTPPPVALPILDLTTGGCNFAVNAQGELVVTDSDPVDPTITGVSIAGAATLNEGATSQYAATVTGTGPFNPAVTWTCSDGTISAAGIFTAPLKVENVNITATSVEDPTKFATFPVSIALPTNTVTIAASGGDDTAAVQAAINSTAAAGKILEFLTKGGTWHVNPLTIPAGANLLWDPGNLCTDQSAYSSHAVMFNIAGSNVKITATGAFFQMPLSLAASKADGQEYRHCFAIQPSAQINNVSIVGPSVKSAGGDCLYVHNCANLIVATFSGTGAYRNGTSVTGQVNNATFTNINNFANGGGDFDFEPNLDTDYLTNIVINQLTTGGGTNGGLNFGLQHLDSTSKPVSITVNGYTSTGNGGTTGPGYPIFFDSNQDGKTPVSGAVVVNGSNIANSPSAAIYGKNTGGNGFCTFTFNNIVTSNTNTGGPDRYGVSAVVGVELYGGQPGPAGNAIFNPTSIKAGAKSTAYFQIASGAVNTQFNGSSATCTGGPAGAKVKYP